MLNETSLIEEMIEDLKKKVGDNLPSHFFQPHLWVETITELRSSWETFYQVFVNEYLYPFVAEENSNIFNNDNREAYRMDIENKNRIKSATSIIDKITRTIDKQKIPFLRGYNSKNLREFIEDYMLKIDDIVRCRILCNYQSDMDEIDKNLTTEFVKATTNSKITYCSEKRRDKRIEAGRSFEKGAHRAIHEYFQMERDGKIYYLEIQIMTFLQEAWDIKQHLIYEKIRRKINTPKIQHIKDRFHILSGLLMIADEFADKTWKIYQKGGR
ncbi:MAG: hypothetical protein AB1630_05450 [bacterium]